MSTFLLLLPAGLSLLVLAAHFLRRAQSPAVLLCFGLFALLWVRRPWATRVVQLALVAGAAIWTRTLLGFAAARRAAGEPWERMALILGIVAGISLLAALAFELPALKRRDGRIGPPPVA